MHFFEKNELVSKNAVIFSEPEKKKQLVSVRIELFLKKKKTEQNKKTDFGKKTPPKTTCSKIWMIDSMDYEKIFYYSELND